MCIYIYVYIYMYIYIYIYTCIYVYMYTCMKQISLNMPYIKKTFTKYKVYLIIIVLSACA